MNIIFKIEQQTCLDKHGKSLEALFDAGPFYISSSKSTREIGEAISESQILDQENQNFMY